MRKTAHVLAAGLAWLAFASSTQARLLSDSELAQVHAAGLPDPQRPFDVTLTSVAPQPSQDPSASLERQQALAQARLAAASTQGALGLMQAASVATLFTPVAPLFLPAAALPFPFLMLAPPPKKSDAGH